MSDDARIVDSFIGAGEDEYCIVASCCNCDEEEVGVIIQKGTTVNDAFNTLECPACGCCDLQKRVVED